jgi:acyl-CoA reductase-like NAD-dependent aldehyde dehydrogenase
LQLEEQLTQERAKRVEAEGDVSRLIEALHFYAEKSSYEPLQYMEYDWSGCPVGEYYSAPIERVDNFGDLARKALSSTPNNQYQERLKCLEAVADAARDSRIGGFIGANIAYEKLDQAIAELDKTVGGK